MKQKHGNLPNGGSGESTGDFRRAETVATQEGAPIHVGV